MDRCIIRCIVGLEHCYFVTNGTKDECSLRAVRQFKTCLADHNKSESSPRVPDKVSNLVKEPH